MTYQGAQSFSDDMARAVVRTKRVEGSIVVKLPKEVIEREDIHEGDMVEVEVRKARKARKSGFGIDPGIGHMTREDELDTHF